jgi:hypothetical protein
VGLDIAFALDGVSVIYIAHPKMMFCGFARSAVSLQQKDIKIVRQHKAMNFNMDKPHI